MYRNNKYEGIGGRDALRSAGKERKKPHILKVNYVLGTVHIFLFNFHYSPQASYYNCI